MKANEVVDLGDDWQAVWTPILWTPMFNGPHQFMIKHRCFKLDRYGVLEGQVKGDAKVYPLQKNTHRRHGIRWRCQNCHTIAPKRVMVFLKLHKLYEKVN